MGLARFIGGIYFFIIWARGTTHNAHKNSYTHHTYLELLFLFLVLIFFLDLDFWILDREGR